MYVCVLCVCVLFDRSIDSLTKYAFQLVLRAAIPLILGDFIQHQQQSSLNYCNQSVGMAFGGVNHPSIPPKISMNTTA